MLAAAERAIPVPPDSEAAWNTWLQTYKSDPMESVPIPTPILNALSDDPRNADRLSNLAVALYFAVLTEPRNPSEQEPPVEMDRRVGNALGLLSATAEAFPESRSAVLNYAFLHAFYITMAGTAFGGTTPLEMLEAWLRRHPDDVTALQIEAAEYFGRRYIEATESEIIEPHLDRLTAMPDGRYAALGYALRGDLTLRWARAQQATSPFMAAQTARAAVQAYDQALARSDDPSIYAARAVALEFLGDIPAAIATQQRAVALQPDSVPLRILLAEFYSRQPGDAGQVQAALRQARETSREALALASSQTPLLMDVQFKVDPELYSGHRRGVEYTAFRPARTYLHLQPRAGGAAGYILSYDLIPLFDREPKLGADVSLPAERAAQNAIIASVMLGDTAGADDDIQHALRFIADHDSFDAMERVTPDYWERARSAARLAADVNAPSDSDLASGLSLAVDALRYAGLPERAAVLCRTTLEYPDPAPSRDYLLKCLGDNAYLAGEYDLARQAFAGLESPLYEGFVAQVAGDRDEAIRLYEIALPETPSHMWAAAALLLGDAYLDAGDQAGAIALYDQAISPPVTSSSSEVVESLVVQRLHNNRAVARLAMHTRSGVAPDCSGAAASACADALADFTAAARSDPYNPLYLLGKGWVERLQGNGEAAFHTLSQAVQGDPTLFPALNDLGVIAAHRGDLSGARQAFLNALAINPEYDLALWNLGVLEMQRGISGIPRGQAYLAQAILRSPSFAASPPFYRFDNEIYRVEFTERLLPGAGWSFGSAFSRATAAFGFVTALLVAMRLALKEVGKDKVQDVTGSWAETTAKWWTRKVRLKPRLAPRPGWSRWLPLLITLPALAFVTSWSALREDSDAALAVVCLTLFASLTAVIVHEAGHVLVALRKRSRVRPAQWNMGALFALLLLPAQISAGPFPGVRVQDDDEDAVWWVYLGGPLANLLFALGTYALYFYQPLPLLRLIAIAQFAAMGYALLPFEPLDGAALSRSRPIVLRVLVSIVLVAGIVTTLGYL
jgi:tetratricopeptide (TPR) repeat protein